MTHSIGEAAQPSSETPDEMFAGHFKRQLEGTGFHVEYGGDTKDNVTTYYALVMKEEAYAQLLEEQNQQAGAAHAEYHKYSVGQKSTFQPSDTLDWETAISQPTFSGGHASREDALMAAGAPLLFAD